MKHTLFIKYIGSLLFTLFLAGCSDVYEDSLWTVSKQAESLGLSLNQLSFTSDAGSKSLNVTGQNIPWRFSNNAQWVSFSPSSGQSAASVDVSVLANTSEVARTAYAQLVSTAQSASRTYDLTISQSAKEPYISLSPSSLDFKGEGASSTVTVESNRTWTFQLADAATASWLSVTRNGNALTITASVNEGSVAREAYINVTTGTLTEQIHVIQRVVDITASVESLDFGYAESEQLISLKTDTRWTASCSQTWIQVTPERGDASDNAFDLSVRVTSNTSSSARTGYIYVYVGATKKLQITVNQAAYTLAGEVSQSSFTHEGGTATLSVNANVDWKLTAPAWVSLSADKGSGSKDVTFEVLANGNTSGRNGNITLSSTDGSVSIPIAISQSGRPESSEETRDLGHVFLSKGESLEVSPIENESWTAEVVSGDDWISLSPASGSSTQQLIITTTDNPSGQQRSGSIRITYGYHSYLCSVQQQGKTLSLSTNRIDFFAKGGESQSVIVTADKVATVTKEAGWLTIKQSGNTFTLVAEKNTDSNLRTAIVKVSLAGVSDLEPVNVTVRQAGVNGTFQFDEYDEEENWDEKK